MTEKSAIEIFNMNMNMFQIRGVLSLQSHGKVLFGLHGIIGCITLSGHRNEVILPVWYPVLIVHL